MHPKYHTIFYLACGTLIGIGSTLPRCAATTHEIGVQNLIPGAPIWVTVVIFFALVYFFACDRDSVVDKLGGLFGGLICIVALFAVYGTLTYLGGTASGIYPQDTPQTAILSGIINLVMGKFGLGLMGCAVALACLTTAVGIGATVVGFLCDFTQNRIPYRVMTLATCIIATVMGIGGVQNLVNYVTPIFLVIYPMCIVMTVLGLLDRIVPNDGVYFGGVLVAGTVSLGDAILFLNPNLEFLRAMMSALPFSGLGFAWVVPTLLGMAVFGVLFRGKPKYAPAPLEETAT